MSSTLFLCASLIISGGLSITGSSISARIFSCTKGHVLALNIILKISQSIIFVKAAKLAIAAEMWLVALLKWLNRQTQCSITSLSFCCHGSLLATSSPETASSSGSETHTCSGFDSSHSPMQVGFQIAAITVPTFALVISGQVFSIWFFTNFMVTSNESSLSSHSRSLTPSKIFSRPSTYSFASATLVGH